MAESVILKPKGCSNAGCSAISLRRSVDVSVAIDRRSSGIDCRSEVSGTVGLLSSFKVCLNETTSKATDSPTHPGVTLVGLRCSRANA